MGAPIERTKFYPNTLASQCGSEVQAARLRAALHVTLTNRPLEMTSPAAGRRTERVFHVLGKLDGLVTATPEPPPFRLSDFTIPESQEVVIERLRRSTFLPIDAPEFQELVVQTRTVEDRSYFNKKGNDGYKLIEKFDQLTYERIKEEYELGSIADAQEFFEKRVDEANDVLESIIPSRHKNSGDVTSLINEARFITSPGRALLYALSPDVDQRLQYEALRTLTIAELFAQSAKHAKGLKAVIAEYQTALGDSIFDHGQRMGEIRPVHIYAIFDIATGEPLWNSYSDEALTPQQYKEYSQRGMLKLINFNVRQSDDGKNVLTEPRTKEQHAILEKMIKDAQRRKDLLGDEIIEPGGVSDMGGIMQVLLDETSLNGPTMTAFIDRHKQIAREIFGGKDGKDVDFVERDETNGDNGQSKEHRFRRVDIIVKRDGREYKIEMIFVPLVQYLKNQYQYGSLDPRTKTRNGPAHKVYEATRWINPARVLFPEANYGTHKWDEMSKLDVEQAVDEIRRLDAIPFNELPEQYRNRDITAGVAFQAYH